MGRVRPARSGPAADRRPGRPPRSRGPKIDLAQAYKLRVVNRLSFLDIARTLGVSKSGVHAALERLTAVLPDPEQVKAFEAVEPYILTGVKERLLRSLADEPCIEKASLNNRAFAFSQVAHHERLAKGHTTSNLGMLGQLIFDTHRAVFSKSVLSTDPMIETPPTPSNSTDAEKP